MSSNTSNLDILMVTQTKSFVGKKLYAIVGLLAFMVVMEACSGRQEAGTLEEKKAALEKYKQELSDLQGKIDVLEAEIAATDAQSKGPVLRKIEALTLVKKPFEHYFEVRGDVQSNQNVMVTPEIAGVVIRRLVEEGQHVRKGQVIMELDAEVLRRNIAEMETRLSLAKSRYERQANLWNQKIGSELQYLEAKNGMESLEKSIEAQKAQLANASIKSPIDGVLDEFFVNQGEMATQQDQVARIVNLSTVEVSADVSEVYTKYVKKGDSVLVDFPAIGEKRKMVIHTIGQFINPNNRTFRIEIRANNREGLLKPNTLATVTIRDFQKKDAISVPSQLIQQAINGEKFLYRIKKVDGKDVVERVVIKTSQSYNGYTLVEEGLSEGDRVVFKGYNEVVDGEEIEISSAQPQA